MSRIYARGCAICEVGASFELMRKGREQIDASIERFRNALEEIERELQGWEARAGATEKVPMTISGHKTRSVFESYDIVDQRDIRALRPFRAKRGGYDHN